MIRFIEWIIMSDLDGVGRKFMLLLIWFSQSSNITLTSLHNTMMQKEKKLSETKRNYPLEYLLVYPTTNVIFK